MFPFILIVIISLTDETSLAKNGYRFIPKQWSFEAYKYVFKGSSALGQAYSVTIFITIVGTVLALTIMSLYAYALSKKEF